MLGFDDNFREIAYKKQLKTTEHPPSNVVVIVPFKKMVR